MTDHRIQPTVGERGCCLNHTFRIWATCIENTSLLIRLQLFKGRCNCEVFHIPACKVCLIVTQVRFVSERGNLWVIKDKGKKWREGIRRAAR